VNEENVAALADEVGLALPPDRVHRVLELLEALTRDGGGVTPDEVVGVEPATSFDPPWPS
jgi:hypothetical protein